MYIFILCRFVLQICRQHCLKVDMAVLSMVNEGDELNIFIIV